MASVRADPKESVAQGEVTEAAMKREGEMAPTSHEAEAHESDEGKAPLVAEATEGEAEAPWTSEAEVTEAGASRTTKAKVVEAGSLGTTKTEVVEAGVGATKLVAQEAETETGQALVPPLVQDMSPSQESAQKVEVHSISSNDTSWGREVADAKAASTVEQPALTSSEGSSALVRSVEVEDLRLCYANMKAKAATAWEQAIPLATWIKELEEELTQVAGERDAFWSWAKQAEISAKAIAMQLGAEQGMHLLMKGALAKTLKVAEASRVEALAWKEKAEGLEKEVSQVAKASVEVQAVLEAKIREHNVLYSATRTTCDALEVGGVESGNSLRSRLIALSGRVHKRLRGALHTGVKRALAVVSLHYTSIDLEAISDGYILAEDDEDTEEEDHAVGTFYLAVCPRVSYGRLGHTDVVVVAEC
ncbi:uncharacterized protein [Miscanthus floridulus]|uniref:uncharacterized protein n=1 Tax=Miscanthus floridulus TaxID=154761 RepID=UPI003457D525